MILPQSYLTEYNKKKDLYNQTVSKADQIALCSYIRDGHLSSQIRKTRKLYMQKSKILTDLLVESFTKNVTILKTNSPLYVRCKLNFDLSTKDLCDRAEKSGILLIPTNFETDFPEIAFSVASVGLESLENAVKTLKNVVING